MWGPNLFCVPETAALLGTCSIERRRGIVKVEANTFVLHHLAEVITISVQISLKTHAHYIFENRQQHASEVTAYLRHPDFEFRILRY